MPHGPFLVKVFDEKATNIIRNQILVLDTSGIIHEQDKIFDSICPSINTAVPGLKVDANTFKIRVYPKKEDGVDLHVDLDYVLKFLQPKDTCITCLQRINPEVSEEKQIGMHWTKSKKKCRIPPIDPKDFTLAVNLSVSPMSIVSFANQPTNVALSREKHIIPVVSPNVTMHPFVLEPGQGVLFSAWLVHRSSPESLQGDRISMDMRGKFPPTFSFSSSSPRGSATPVKKKKRGHK